MPEEVEDFEEDVFTEEEKEEEEKGVEEEEEEGAQEEEKEEEEEEEEEKDKERPIAVGAAADKPAIPRIFVRRSSVR